MKKQLMKKQIKRKPKLENMEEKLRKAAYRDWEICSYLKKRES